MEFLVQEIEGYTMSWKDYVFYILEFLSVLLFQLQKWGRNDNAASCCENLLMLQKKNYQAINDKVNIAPDFVRSHIAWLIQERIDELGR